MPKHSINALIGFTTSTTAAAKRQHQALLAKGCDHRERIATLEELCGQMIAADQEAKSLRARAKDKAAEARRLKKAVYAATSELVDLSAGFLGRSTGAGQELRRYRKTLRRRRSPRRTPPVAG